MNTKRMKLTSQKYHLMSMLIDLIALNERFSACTWVHYGTKQINFTRTNFNKITPNDRKEEKIYS